MKNSAATLYLQFMRVSQIIQIKGTGVVSLPPTSSIAQLVAMLAARRIGAIVVMNGEKLAGIVSERDVVRTVRAAGDFFCRVSAIMTADVTTCSPDDDVQELATVMTAKRIRHLPVVDGGKVLAIVSIGDIVKARLDELEEERDHLERYITG